MSRPTSRVSQQSHVSSEPAKSEAAQSGSANKESVPDQMASGQRMVFSGPNGLRDHRVTVPENFMATGIGERSPESSSQISYLTRPAPNAAFPKSKQGYVGEIGWPVRFFPISPGQ